jgi:hypothetical protein
MHEVLKEDGRGGVKAYMVMQRDIGSIAVLSHSQLCDRKRKSKTILVNGPARKNNLSTVFRDKVGQHVVGVLLLLRTTG